MLAAASTVGLCAFAVTALGLGLVVTARPVARLLAFVLALGFAVVAAMADRTEPRSIAPRNSSAKLSGSGDDTAVRTALLMAACDAGPRAVELRLQWQPAFVSGGDLPIAALGASPVMPRALPLAPADVRLRAVGALLPDRPTMLEVSVEALERSLSAEMVVRFAGGEVLRESLRIGGGVASVPFLPTSAGQYEVALHIDIDGHRLTASGRFDVATAEQVLVVEPSGVVAAALRAQGVRVREVAELPDDWSRHRQIVLGRPLQVGQQQALVAAVLDGTGLFVLAPAFGAVGSPLRALLPVRPLPVQPGDDRGEGQGDGREPGPSPEEPPAGEPVGEPPANEPPDEADVGDTRGSSPVSPEPIEVDKHTIAMVLVVDRSGSMGSVLRNGRSKMSYAKTSALLTAQALGEGDHVGVVTFGNKGAGRVELALVDAVDEVAVHAGIERLAHVSGEGTFLLSGLRQAHAMLRGHEAAVKHVVVLTDGEFRVEESLALRAEAHKMRSRGHITVSIISIIDRSADPGFKEEAEKITRDGGGEFLPLENAARVPVFVSAEVTRALSRVGRKPRRSSDGNEPRPDSPPPPEPPPPEPPAEEPALAPAPDAPRLPVRAVTESALLAPDPIEWPTLADAVATEAPLEARVLLVAGDQGWPLLAYANRGLGRIGAFAADLTGQAGAEFCEAAAFPAWLAQWVVATAPAETSPEPRDLRDGGGVEPPAPVPDDIAWLSAVGGAPAVMPAVGTAHVAAGAAEVVGRAVLDQVAGAARWLLLGLVLLALGERLSAARALRRGRN